MILSHEQQANNLTSTTRALSKVVQLELELEQVQPTALL
jgi:hypothetical protein